MNYDILVTIVIVIFSLIMTFESTKLGVGSLTSPGSGFLPMLSSSLIAFLSLLYLASRLVKQGHKKIDFRLGPYWKRAFFMMIFSFFYIVILWDKLGYLVSTFFWLGFLLKVGGMRSWAKTILIPAGAVIVTYLIFEKVGQIQLPKGILGF